MTSEPRKAARKVSPSQRRRDKIAAALSPGDQVEYGLTAEVKHPRKGSWWIKVGATTTVREGEDGLMAKARATEFVHLTIEDQVSEVLED